MKFDHTILSLFALLLICTMVSVSAEANQKKQKKTKGWIGVSIQDVTPKFARENKLKVNEGVYIDDVVDDGPADSAGLQEGDVIVEFNGKKIEFSEDLMKAVRDVKPREKVSLSYYREGTKKSMEITVGKNRMVTLAPLAELPHMRGIFLRSQNDIEGIQCVKLSEQLGKYFEVPNGEGVLVQEVEPKSNGEKAGFKAGDVITKIGDEEINDLDDLIDTFDETDEGDKVAIEYYRKGKKSTTTLEISEDSRDRYHFQWKSAPGHNGMMHFEMFEDDIPAKLQKELQLRKLELPKIEKKLREIRLKRGVDEV